VAQDAVFWINSKRKSLSLKTHLISRNIQFSYILKNKSFYVVSGTSRCFLDKFKTKTALFKDAFNIAEQSIFMPNKKPIILCCKWQKMLFFR
jgi:hypothetical protein